MVKNLAQLKTMVNNKTPFVIVNHYIKPECVGQVRVPNIIQTNGFYSVIKNDIEHPVSKANNGKGYWMEYGKASEWKFGNGICTNYHYDKPVWSIKFLVYLLGEIYDKVMEDYRKHAVMLNSLFFDFNVENIRKIDLVEVYKKIIHDVNGDYVIRVKNPVYDKDKEFIVSGTEVELDDGSMNELYTGNMKDFLESLNGNDLGIVRLMDYAINNNKEIKNGILLDFVA